MMEYEEMRSMEGDYVCGMCNAPVVTIWDKDLDNYRLACGNDKSHNGMTRRPTSKQMLQRGQVDEVIGPGAQTDLEKRAKHNAQQWAMVPKTDLGDNKILNLGQLQALQDWAESMGLNILLGHACYYHGQPYPTIDGYYYLNHHRENPYSVGTRPMTKEERTAAMIEDGAHAWIAEAWLDGVKLADSGTGYIGESELNAKSKNDPEKFRAPVVHDKPQRMAEKRAEWQLLRKLIPLEVKE